MSSWLSREAVSQIISLGISNIIILISPFVLSAVAVLSGWIEHVPFMWIIMAAVVIFAMTVVGILCVYIFLSAWTPKNKVEIKPFTFAWDAKENDDKGMAIKMGNVAITANYLNRAHFPISVITEKFDVVIDNNINTEKTSRGQSLIIGPQQEGWFRDNPISLKGVPCTNFDGKVSLTVKYGRPGKEIYQSKTDVVIRLIFDSTKGLYSLDVAQDIHAKSGGGA